jgi:hypothetical protein
MIGILTAVLAAWFAVAGLTYTAPTGWTVVPTSSSMRVAQFTLPRAAGDTETAEMIVYYFGGSGGSVEANIDRWIGQMQQPDGRSSKAAAKRESRMVKGLSVSLVDVSGTYVAETAPGSATRHNSPNFRLRAGVIQTPKGPYFIKLTGPAKTVAAQSQAFEGFVASLSYTP